MARHVQDFLRLAAMAKRLATEATDPKARSEHELDALQWRNLAEKYQLVETNEANLRRDRCLEQIDSENNATLVPDTDAAGRSAAGGHVTATGRSETEFERT